MLRESPPLVFCITLVILLSAGVSAVTRQEIPVAISPSSMRDLEEVAAERKLRTQRIADLLKAGDISGVFQTFNSDLNRTISETELKMLWDEFTSRHGAVLIAKSNNWRILGIAQFSRIEVHFKSVTYEFLIDYDDNEQVAGFWIYRSDKVSNGMPRAGQRYGKRIQELQQWNSRVRVRVLDADAEKAEYCEAKFYRKLNNGDSPLRSDWIDPATKESWRSFFSGSGRGDVVAEYLPPGWYRVFAWQGRPGQSQFAFSEPVELSGSSTEQTIEVRTLPGTPVDVTAVNGDNGGEFSNAWVRLSRQNADLPPFTFFSWGRLEHVPAGRYTVAAGKFAETYRDLQYESKDGVEIFVESKKPQNVRIELQGRFLTAEEKNAMAPWIVKGRVTDSGGAPIDGAEIRGVAGLGSMTSKVIAVTDRDGRYEGRISPTGWVSIEPEEGSDSIVYASIGAYKEEMVEQNENRHGVMHATYGVGLPEETLPGHVDPRRLLFRGAPREVNFILEMTQ